MVLEVERGQIAAFEAWFTPLFWWTCFLGTIAFAIFCLGVMLYKQWVDNGRLIYQFLKLVGFWLRQKKAAG